MRTINKLGQGYTSEVDTVDEQRWNQILQEFNDANIYQTYAFGEVSSGRRNLSHLILKKDGEIVAVAQAKVVRLPFLNIGTASIGAGPLWKRGPSEPDLEVFRQAVRALRNEYVCKRGLVLRLFAHFFDDDDPCFSEILAEEGFSLAPTKVRNRTILMDLSPSLDSLYEGMAKHWRRNLRRAQRAELEIVEGTGENLFEEFLGIYREMVSRKKFLSFVDINKFREAQARLPENFKMIVMLCRSAEGVCAGLICTAIGNSATYLLGATSDANKKSCGSYLLQWKLIEKLKQRGISIYDLCGIDPVKNPGTYSFKSQLSGENGREVCHVGRFDSHSGFFSYTCVNFRDQLKTIQRNLKELFRPSSIERLRIKGAR